MPGIATATGRQYFQQRRPTKSKRHQDNALGNQTKEGIEVLKAAGTFEAQRTETEPGKPVFVGLADRLGIGPEERVDLMIVGQRHSVHLSDPAFGRGGDDAFEQPPAKAPTLPFVRYRDGNLGDGGFDLKPRESCYAHNSLMSSTSVHWNGHDGIVVLVIALGQGAQFFFREIGLGRQEALPPGLNRQAPESLRQGGLVRRTDHTEFESGPVVQHDPFPIRA